MPEREVDSPNQSETNSYQTSDDVVIMDVVAVSKKRKFQTEQFGLLPLPKHPCSNKDDSPIVSDEPCDDRNNNNDNIDRCSKTASVKDSNSSAAGNFECAESSASSSSFCLKNNIEFESMECTDEIKDGSSGSSVGDGIFQKHLEFVCSEYTEKDIEDVLYPDNDVKQHNATYVLSSGRWNVNQDSSQEVTRKPTIDQEFEEHFSMLML